MSTFCFIDPRDGRVACNETTLSNPDMDTTATTSTLPSDIVPELQQFMPGCFTPIPGTTMGVVSGAEGGDYQVQVVDDSNPAFVIAAYAEGVGAFRRCATDATVLPTDGGQVLPQPEPLPEGCCVHVATDDMANVTVDTPAAGRLDCPTLPELDKSDVMVVGLTDDGDGGMLALFTAAVPSSSSTTTATQPTLYVAPICTIGPQEVIVRCCIGSDGRVQCIDEEGNLKLDDPAHGMDANEAIKSGMTLQLCDQPPPEIEGCCVQIGPQLDGRRHQAMIVCDDPSRPNSLHGMVIEVTLSEDGTTANWFATDTLEITLPVCVDEVVEEEIPCCVEGDVLVCRDADGNVLSEFDGKTLDEVGDLGLRIKACPSKAVPETPPTPDCCVVLMPDGGVVLVCQPLVGATGTVDSPFNGYEIDPANVSLASDGSVATVVMEGPDGAPVSFTFPVCPVRPPPSDGLCYDAATGTLSSADAQFDGVTPALIRMLSGGPGGQMAAVVRVMDQVMTVPLCPTEQPPLECCYKPSGDGSATGILVCQDDLGQSTSAYDGMPATLLDLNTMDGKTPLATVAFEGGTATVPVCAELKPDDVFCCVNLDVGLFVCPGRPDVDGTPASIRSVIEHQGLQFAQLTDGRVLPACGTACPAPVVCPECPAPGECPEPPPCPPAEVIERIVEVPVERIVERIVEVPSQAPAAPNSGNPWWCTPSTLGANGLPAVFQQGGAVPGFRTTAQPPLGTALAFDGSTPVVRAYTNSSIPGPMRTGSRS